MRGLNAVAAGGTDRHIAPHVPRARSLAARAPAIDADIYL